MSEKTKRGWFRDVVLFLVAGLLLALCWCWQGFSLSSFSPMRRGSLTWSPRSAKLGSFTVRWRGSRWSDSRLEVVHVQSPGRVLWQSVRGMGFVGAARGKEHVEESRGSFFLKDRWDDTCFSQDVGAWEVSSEAVSIRGTLRCAQRTKALEYTFRFQRESEHQLRFQLEVSDNAYQRTFLRYASEPDEAFFGFGEQFTYANVKGRRLPLFVMEQGIGRGAQPITAGANLTAKAGGDWHTTYAGVPHYVTSRLRSLFLETYEYSVFDLRHAHRAEVMLLSSRMCGRIVHGKSPLALVSEYTRYSGRMRTLPDWVHNGAIIGMQGGTAKVRKVWSKLKSEGTPVAGFWLQDWVGQRTTSFGKQLWWNWELDREHYPGWDELVAEMKKAGAEVLLYINPFLADVKEKKNARRNLFAEAKKQGFLVQDKKKRPYMILNTSFSAGLLDLTNPKTRAWIKQVMKDEMLSVGASGWMADFGEALPYDAVLSSGESPTQAHNRYPEMWAKVNRELLDTAPHQGRNMMFFMRAAYTKSPRWSTMFWLGDQLVSWDKYDGIKTVVTGMISSGISGFSLNHSDIGGYTTITHPIRDYHRSAELHMRWAELSAFTPIYRTHEGNRPAANHQFHSTPETLKHFSRFAKVYKAWKLYRKQLVEEAASKGYPVIRHPFLHYPRDRVFYKMDFQQFMVGADWMVAPVLEPGAQRVRVYLPRGTWVHLWTNQHYEIRTQGQWFDAWAPVGEPAVFMKAGSFSGQQFRIHLRAAGLLKQGRRIQVLTPVYQGEARAKAKIDVWVPSEQESLAPEVPSPELKPTIRIAPGKRKVPPSLRRKSPPSLPTRPATSRPVLVRPTSYPTVP